MKKLIKIIMVLSLFCMVGCSKPSSEIDITQEIFFPNSFYDFCGMTSDEVIDTCERLGDDFCEEVKIIDEGIKIKFTEQQLKNYIDANEDKINNGVDAFLSNENYKCSIDENQKKSYCILMKILAKW